MKLSIVLSTQPTRFEAVAFEGSFERNLAYIAGLGYTGVELAIRRPSDMDFARLAALLERHDLAVPAIGTGQAWGEERLSFTDPKAEVRRAALDRACSHIPFAAETGALIVIGLLRGVVQQGVTHAQAMQWLLDALRVFSGEAARESVRICLEPLNRYETDLVHDVAEGLNLIEAVGADNLGLLLDTFHMNIEEPDMAAAIRLCGDRLFHFHVADSNRWHPGAGHIDFGRALAALLEIGYSGYVSGEFMARPDADTAAAKAIAHLRAVMPANPA